MSKFIQLNVRNAGSCFINVDQILMVGPHNENGRQIGSKIKLSNEILIVIETVTQVMTSINK